MSVPVEGCRSQYLTIVMSLSDDRNWENAGPLCCLGIQAGGSFILALLRCGPIFLTLIMRRVIHPVTASQIKRKDTTEALVKVANKSQMSIRCVLMVDIFAASESRESTF